MFASLQDLVSLQLSLPFEDACFALEIEDIVPSTCQGNGERQMDARGRVSAPSKSALMQLSSELLVLILEQLREIHLPSLKTIHLVSRRCNAIALPIFYEAITLTEAIVHHDAARRFPGATQHIARYTNHVAIRSDLDAGGIRRVLSSVQRLRSVRWCFVPQDVPSSDLWLPSELTLRNEAKVGNVDLHVENLPLHEFEVDAGDSYMRAIPAALLVSLELTRPAPPLTTKLAALQRLLSQSRRLQTLHYEDRGQGTSFTFQGEERLPPVTNLLLGSYNWDHSADDVRRHWDFSRLRSLRLISVPAFNFLSSIDPDQLAGLHTLQIEDWSAHLPDRRREATRALYLLVKHHIQRLEELDVVCHITQFPLDAILHQRQTLQILRFRDHVGFWDEYRPCPTLPSEGLASLALQLPHVHTLEVDMDISMCQSSDFLNALCLFRSLRSLTIHTQTAISYDDDAPPGLDRDYEAATKTFKVLVNSRQQNGLDVVPWKRITINVGGWRRVMVRRVSAEWRRKNDKGVFAERCFVLERSSKGQFGVREEMCVEIPSRRSTPDA